VGCGVELPPSQRHDVTTAAQSNEPSDDDDRSEEVGTNGNNEVGSRLSSRGAVFRRRHRLYGPLVLYGGRIDPGKGCEELIDYFNTYAESEGDASLVLMGMKLMPIPDAPHIRFAGLLSEAERFEALEAATVVVVPSPFESLSLLALESFSIGTPVLANARSEVVMDHCQRSNGGLYYANRDEFRECLRLLVQDARLRAALGRNGRGYVRTNYRWDVIMGKYDRLIAGVQPARPQTPGRGNSARSSGSRSGGNRSGSSRSGGRRRGGRKH